MVTGYPRTGPESPWWSDALTDPWRDPGAPSAVVIRSPGAVPPPAGTAVTVPIAGDVGRRGLGLIFLIVLVTALLAGGLGGTLGFVFAGGGSGRTVLGNGGGASAAPLAQRPPTSLAGVVARVLPSVVTIKIGTSSGYSLGSGFIISPDGYVETNDHVVEGLSGSATVTFSDSSVGTARLVGVDEESDVAVLKLARTGLPAVQFGDSDQIAVGDPVLAFGAPLALSNTVTYGIVSALNRTMEADEPGGPSRYYAAIQTDAAVNHGNSGGPLVDSAGRVIGMNSVIKSLASDSQDAGNIGLAFAIPINQAKRIAMDIIETGHARRTVIGAQLRDSYTNPDGGVQLASVDAAGPAARAGLKANDVLMKIDGVPMDQPSDLIALVRKYAPGDAVRVDYRRGASAATVQVTLTADAK
ncbi:MAG TPA: trypsin-like peptidase domain-containing protein [Rugosimonospora sp.]|nr:trypsin-like peptidase domain-containing protein [Rugosimonospora sp.]